MKVTVREGRSMASPLRLTLPGLVASEADSAWEMVRTVFERAERTLTRFDAASPLSALNRAAGATIGVPPMLAQALAAAWRAYRVTRGRFDPRILGALEAAGERAGVGLPPSPHRLGADARWLWLDRRRASACVSAPIDLGGIGKGLALRWAAAALRRSRRDRFLIQAGGDLVAAGTGPGDGPWIIGLEEPTPARSVVATIEIQDAALATSSIAVHPRHLIDPTTLQPAEPVWGSVSVLDRDPAWADVWSTVAFLAGSEIETAARGRVAWWVSPDGRVHSSGTATGSHARNVRARAGRALGASARRAPRASPGHSPTR